MVPLMHRGMSRRRWMVVGRREFVLKWTENSDDVDDDGDGVMVVMMMIMIMIMIMVMVMVVMKIFS